MGRASTSSTSARFDAHPREPMRRCCLPEVGIHPYPAVRDAAARFAFATRPAEELNQSRDHRAVMVTLTLTSVSNLMSTGVIVAVTADFRQSELGIRRDPRSHPNLSTGRHRLPIDRIASMARAGAGASGCICCAPDHLGRGDVAVRMVSAAAALMGIGRRGRSSTITFGFGARWRARPARCSAIICPISQRPAPAL